MPEKSAAIGLANESAAIRLVAMPSTPALTAVLIALTIWATLLDAEPVHS